MTHFPYAERVEFVVELARRLHTYGTTAQRLEGSVSAVAQRLRLRCSPWANPTGMILSFSDASEPEILANTTQVLRLAPGDVDLRKLCQADAIAESMLSGDVGVREATAALHALDRPPSLRAEALGAISFGLASGSVATILRSSWADVAVAAGIGGLIGLLVWAGTKRPRLSESLELIAGLVATLIAACVASFIMPLSLNTVVVASLIVLMPGLTLTNAISELASQQLVTGTARFAGAVAVLLKLGFGSVMALQMLDVMGVTPRQHPETAQVPAWAEWLALAVSAYAFAVLFKAARRDYPLVMAAVVCGYLFTRLASLWLPGTAAVFVASLGITVLSNVYARRFNRPGAVIRVPGIILMVPGSVGFRGISSILDQNLQLGFDTGMKLLAVLAALVGGILIGNVLYPARRNL